MQLYFSYLVRDIVLSGRQLSTFRICILPFVFMKDRNISLGTVPITILRELPLLSIRKMKDYQNTHCYSTEDRNRNLLMIAPRCQHLLQAAHNLCDQLTVSTPTSSRSRARTAAIFGSDVLWMMFSTMDISSSLFVPSSRFRRSTATVMCFMHSLWRDTIQQTWDVMDHIWCYSQSKNCVND